MAPISIKNADSLLKAQATDKMSLVNATQEVKFERKGDTKMIKRSVMLVAVALFLAFSIAFAVVSRQNRTLKQAREGFVTKLIPQPREKTPVPAPPPNMFQLVHYDSPKGKLPAYLSLDPHDGKRHPVIIWIMGGEGHSIDEYLWKAPDMSNDQSVSAYRDSGVMIMHPSLRGGNDNPGEQEGFLGEVDDVIAAADFLAKQEYIDPDRIYLGGHSTGGTLVLLTAEMTAKFRAVFSFGPTDDISRYGVDRQPFDVSNRKEIDLRSPGLWLNSIKSPVFVFEGTVDPSNIGSVEIMQKSSENPLIHFFSVEGATHFSILDPTNMLIAKKILADDGKIMNIEFNEDALNRPFLRK